jgi:hypothetical protein
MATYVNKSLGVVNAGGQFAAPGQTLNVPDTTPGIEHLVRKGVLVKAEASPSAKVSEKTQGVSPSTKTGRKAD